MGASWLLQIGLVCAQSLMLRSLRSVVVKMLTDQHEIPQPTEPWFVSSCIGEVVNLFDTWLIEPRWIFLQCQPFCSFIGIHVTRRCCCQPPNSCLSRISFRCVLLLELVQRMICSKDEIILTLFGSSDWVSCL